MRSPKRTVDLRRLNRQMVLRHLYFNAPLSRLELSQQTELSPATVSNVVAALLEEALVRETGLEDSEGGRPRTLLAINPPAGHLVGVDLGETHVKLEAFDLTMRNLGTVQHLVGPDDNAPARYVEHIAAGLQELLAQTRLRPEALLGVGVGVPGVVTREAAGGPGTVSAPLWKWQSVPLLDLLAARLPCPLFLDNGAKAMTLAEAWFGAGRSVNDLAVVLLGTGVGAGIITGGALYRGATNSAGEWGHTKLALDGRPCRCGSRGCLEAYTGAPGILATLRETRPDSPWLATDSQMASLSSLAGALDQQDPTALAVLNTTAQYLGAGLANLINLFNPEQILIGGWAGLTVGRALLPRLQGYVEQYTLPAPFSVVRIALCQLGQDAICMGAACLVLERFLAGDLAQRSPAGA